MKIQDAADLFDLENLPVMKQFRAYMASSYDREGGNYDWGNYEQVIGQDGVIMDVDGPGIITRMWSADPAGQIRIYLDMNDSPVIDEPFEQFLQRLPLHFGVGYPQPNTPEFEAAIAALKPLGHTAYCPIPFNNGCKIVLSPVPQVYYQVNYMLCDVPHGLPTFSDNNRQTNAGEYTRIIDKISHSSYAQSPSVKRTNGRSLLKAGEQCVLFDQGGPLIIRALRIKLQWPEDEAKNRHLKENLLLRAYWDEDLSIEGLPGHRRPSVKSPVAAFFMDFGAFDSYETMLISKRGTEYTCQFPMPVRKRAVIELLNASCLDTGNIEYEIEYTNQTDWTEELCQFKALYHCEDSTFGYDLGNYRNDVMYLRNQNGHHNYPILRAYGKGHFIGCCFHVDLSETPCPRAGCEADDAVFVDDDPHRTMWGTGNEDYVNDAWGIHPVITPLSGGKNTDRKAFFGYRLHISDCIPFSRKLAFTLEHGSSNNCTGLYRSVAYYYLKSGASNVFIDGVPPRRINHYYSI
ncbi:MAG: DUF2961 domain-containing protein [Kiritimatiellae bacterium]|nr:DUF2961 domain-containing protein [Kiritimatiellia bacterium]